MQICPRREKERQGWDLAFYLASIFSKPITIQWLAEARKIGKRLALLEPSSLSPPLSGETNEVVCGVAGCDARRKKRSLIDD